MYISGQNTFFVIIFIRYSVISCFVVFLPIVPPTIAPTPPNKAPPMMAFPKPPFVID